MPRRSFTVIVLLVITILGLVSAACNGDDGEPSPTETAGAVVSPTSPPAPTDTPSLTPFEGSREPVEVPGGTAPPTPLLVDVRAASHEGFDRIVFEFDGGEPGFRVQYIDEATGCGSGLPVELEGTALLEVHMVPADAHNEAGEPTFAEQELAPGLPSILEAKQTCDFEADVTWVIGLAEEADFTAITQTDPFRIVVDVAHP